MSQAVTAKSREPDSIHDAPPEAPIVQSVFLSESIEFSSRSLPLDRLSILPQVEMGRGLRPKLEGLQLELSKWGVLVRFIDAGAAKTTLIPMTKVRKVELAE